MSDLRAPSKDFSRTGTAELPPGTRRVFIHDLILPAKIGAFTHEHGAHQRVRINLDLVVAEDARPHADDLRNVVDYDDIAAGIRAIVDAGHVNLVETLAERIAGMCLADTRIRRARVRVEKLDVYSDVGSVGVEIERANPLSPT